MRKVRIVQQQWKAVLEAANLLDAWVHRDDTATSHAIGGLTSDGYLVPLPANRKPSGPTLADVLMPEDGTSVDAHRITDVLSSIALAEITGELPAVPTVSSDGAFVQGIQVGAHRKDHAEYIGTTARARRRAARLAELDRQIATTVDAIAALDRNILATQGLLESVTAARRELPPNREMRRHADAAAALRVQRENLDDARSLLDGAIAAVGDRERRLTRIAADRALPADPDGVALFAAAVDRFTTTAAELTSARKQERARAEQAGTAEQEFLAAQDNAAELAEDAQQAEVDHAEQAEGLATLRASVGADVARA